MQQTMRAPGQVPGEKLRCPLTRPAPIFRRARLPINEANDVVFGRHHRQMAFRDRVAGPNNEINLVLIGFWPAPAAGCDTHRDNSAADRHGLEWSGPGADGGAPEALSRPPPVRLAAAERPAATCGNRTRRSADLAARQLAFVTIARYLRRAVPHQPHSVTRLLIDGRCRRATA